MTPLTEIRWRVVLPWPTVANEKAKRRRAIMNGSEARRIPPCLRMMQRRKMLGRMSIKLVEYQANHCMPLVRPIIFICSFSLSCQINTSS